MTDDAPPLPEEGPSADPDALPKHTTPTWEVELLISGIAVFAMLQLPGWLKDSFFDMAPRFDATWEQPVNFGFMIAMMAALILAATFVMHLLLRAHWIALVGLNSVHPDGVRWDVLGLGRRTVEVERKALGTMADAIERADNRATIVFAVGVSMALQMGKMVVLIAVLAVACYVANLFFPISGWLLVVLLGAVILPLVLAWRIDRMLGDRLLPDGVAARALRAVFRGYSMIGFSRSALPVMLLMSSHAGLKRFQLMIFVIAMGATLVTIYEIDATQHPEAIGNYALLPTNAADSADALFPQHYDDQRGTDRLGMSPFVQSQVVGDAFLRVVVPIAPLRMEPAMQHACPPSSAHAANDTTQQAEHRGAILACLSALYPLSLDGQVRHDVHYDLGTDAKTRRPALIAMIDLRALSNGRHELVVGEPPSPDEDTSTTLERIPFWR
jgi:hypothetical protein